MDKPMFRGLLFGMCTKVCAGGHTERPKGLNQVRQLSALRFHSGIYLPVPWTSNK